MAVALAMAAGCGIPAVVDVSPIAWWIVAVVAVVAWGEQARSDRATVASLWLLAAVMAGAACWSTVRTNLFSVDDLAWSLAESPRPVAIEGVVAESARQVSPPALDPLRRDGAQTAMQRPCTECVVAVEAVRDGPRWRTASGRAAVVIDERGRDAAQHLTVGCRVRVLGRGMRPPAPLNPGEFDFQERARSLRCLSIVRTHAADCVEVIAAPSAWSAAALVDRLRSRGVDVLHDHISSRLAPLAAALLLGSRESLPREDSLEFLVTGTIHILSISGLHVGLLSLALFRVFRTLSLPRGWSLLAVAGCTGLYMTLVRAETPVVRATLLVWLGCLGAAIGRRSLAANSLALAAILVLGWHPPELFRTGSQLSFLSTAVLIAASAALTRPTITDPIERLVERSRSPWERRLRWMGRQSWELCVTGAAVWAVTAPVVAWRFHLFSPVGLVLNPVIAPLVAVAMGWGFLCLAAAPVSTWLAAACGSGCDATLRCIGIIVSWAADLPGGYCWVAGPPGWWVAGWYVALVAVLFVMPRERLVRPATWAAVALVWSGVGLATCGIDRLVGSDRPGLRAVVAAMGHGCGIVVHSPTGRCLVYDAGRLGAPAAARRGMAAVLWNEGIGRIDTLVISHADADHFNAVPELLERFAVGEIVVARPFLESESPAVGDVLRQARTAGIPLRVVQAGDSFALDPWCRIRVLHPHPRQPPASRNDNESSLVLAVEAAGRRLLLTGDLEGESLRRFVASGPGECDVLVAPHHGSRTSLPPDIARVTAADWVVVSGPGTLAWPEIHTAYATARGDGRAAAVIKTGGGQASGGAIGILLTAGGVTVEQFAGGRWRRVEPANAIARVRSHGGGPCRTARHQAASIPVAVDSAESGRVNAQPAATSMSWLATNPPKSSRTPLVKP